MIYELIGREVVVRTADVEYSGILVEVGEKEIHLQSETGWIVVPVEYVVDLQAAEPNPDYSSRKGVEL